MDKKTNDFNFSAISIKDAVASRFRMFSKRIAKTHSETLTLVMDFFEWHGFLPSDRFGQSIIEELLKNRKHTEESIARTNASIAIIKSVEKSQNIPLINIETMLKSLFEEEVKKYEPKLTQPRTSDSKKPENEKEKTTVSRMEYDHTKEKLMETKDRLRYVLERVELVNNRFDKDFLKIEITREELARFKQSLKNE